MGGGSVSCALILGKALGLVFIQVHSGVEFIGTGAVAEYHVSFSHPGERGDIFSLFMLEKPERRTDEEGL